MIQRRQNGKYEEIKVRWWWQGSSSKQDGQQRSQPERTWGSGTKWGILVPWPRQKEGGLDKHLWRFLGYTAPSCDPQQNIKAAEPCLRSQELVPSFDNLFSSPKPAPFSRSSKYLSSQGSMGLYLLAHSLASGMQDQILSSNDWAIDTSFLCLEKVRKLLVHSTNICGGHPNGKGPLWKSKENSGSSDKEISTWTESSSCWMCLWIFFWDGAPYN